MFVTTSLSQLILLCTAFFAGATCQSGSSPGTESEPVQLASILRRVEVAQAENRTKRPYHVVRRFRVFPSSNPNSISEVVAELDFRPPYAKNYIVRSRSG